MKIIVLFFSILICGLTKGQQYNALVIPDSMRKGADVIKRDEEYILTVQSSSKYTLYEKHVYTILSAAGDYYAKYKTYYDKFCKINYVSGTLFDATGKEVKHTKRNDWEDKSAFDGFSLFSDARYKESGFYRTSYPYTVAFEEDDEYDGTMAFPQWRPQGIPEMSVQNSKFTFIAPADYLVRYKQLNFNEAPLMTKKGDVKSYTWNIKDIPAQKYEVSSPRFTEITPIVFFAPSKFEVQGYNGDMSTWDGYGKFIYQLIKGRDILPDEIKRKVHDLTDHIKTKNEKIDLLYNFLQTNTRYISVQLGIGGWQPFEASYVAEKKYGDCKALSNYMIALLKEAGITGKYVEIYGGESSPSFESDFSFPQFNHAICCVPLNKDTVWLECTSQTVSPGYMGSFTGNRKALLIDESGGHLVQTPVYKLTDNLLVRKIKAVIDEQGNLNADIRNNYTGLQQELPHSLMNNATKEEREKYLNQMFNFPTYQVIKNAYAEHKGTIPAMDESLQIQVNNYATVTGKRLFIGANLLGKVKEKLFTDTTRRYDYIVNDAYRDVDSVEIKMSVGYKPESLPTDVLLETAFGKYVSSVKVFEDKIIYYRLMEHYSGRFAANKYNELVKFYEQINKADRSRIVFVKSQ